MALSTTFPCEAQEPAGLTEIRRFPAAGETAAKDAPLFEALDPARSGLDFVIPIDTNHPDKRPYYSAMACGGVAVGALDIYVCRYDEPNRLYLNESKPGEFRFREAAAEYALDLTDASLSPIFADYDQDGDLDLFLATNGLYRKGGRPEGGVPMRRVESGWEVVAPWVRYFKLSSIDPQTGVPSFIETARQNIMLRNDGGKFTNVSLAAGLRPVPTHTNGAAWCDYDGDGLLDLYMSNEWGPVRVYMNREGTLEESTEAAGLAAATGFWNSIAGRDLNGDGHIDYLATTLESIALINDGEGHFPLHPSPPLPGSRPFSASPLATSTATATPTRSSRRISLPRSRRPSPTTAVSACSCAAVR